MSELEDTQIRWYVNEPDEDGKFSVFNDFRRTVAEGITYHDEALMIAQAPKLQEDRDALLEALEDLVGSFNGYPFDKYDLFVKAEAALAKAKGEE